MTDGLRDDSGEQRDVDLSGFGFELPLEEWLEQLHAVGSDAQPRTLGAYELRSLEGQGGQGVVYRARQKGTGREVALKRLAGGSFASAESRRRFAREIEAVASLHHPGIVAVYGYEEVDGHPLLVMEWVEGVTVTAWARGEGGRLPELHEVIEMAIAVSDAVQYAHQSGVLHRDLKPSNVLVDSKGRPRVLDFGLAKRLDVEASHVTRSGAFLGTPEYASPEQFDRSLPVDARSDVYALGVMIYEMLTGVRPYGELVEVRAHLNALADEAVRRPSHVRAGLNAEIDAILLKCLAYRPDDRYRSVDGLAGDLRRYLRGEAVLAHPPSTWYQIKKIARRNPTTAVLSAALLALLVVSSVVLWWQARGLAAERERALAEARRTEAVAAYFSQDLINQLHVLELGPEATFLEAIDATQADLGKRFADEPDLEAVVRGSIGSIYRVVGRLDDALVQTERVMQIALSAEPTDPLDTAGAKYLVGTVRLAIDPHDPAAIQLLEESIAEALSVDPVASNIVGAATGFLAPYYDGRGDYARSEQLCRTALDAHRAGGTESHWSRYQQEAWLIGLLIQRGALGEAQEQLTQALAHAREHGDQDLAIDLVLSEGDLAMRAGRHKEAATAFREVLDYYEPSYGPDHAQVVRPLSGLADALHGAGEVDQALGFAQRAYEIVALQSDGRTVGALNRLGAMHLAQNEPEQAFEYLADARRLEDELDRGGPGSAFNRRMLAKACADLGRPDEARELALLAVEELEALVGAEHPDTEWTRALLERLDAAE